MQGNAFRALKILHTALVTGVVMLVAVIFLIKSLQEEKMVDESFENVLQAVAALVSISCLLAGFTIFKRKLAEARNFAGSGEERFDKYRGACLIWWAMLDGPAILAAISYLLTGNVVFIILALFHLGLLFVFMPRKDNIVTLLNLTTEDVQKLEGTAGA